MSVTNTWTIRLLRLVLGFCMAMTAFAAVSSCLLMILMSVLLARMPDFFAMAAGATTPHAAAFAALAGSWPSRILFCAVLLEQLGIAVIVFGSLFRMLSDAARGSVFTERNVFRLRLIAAVYAVSVVSRFTVPFLTPPALRRFLASIQWSFNFGDLILLLVSLVLAEVFREGLRLREEAALTV